MRSDQTLDRLAVRRQLQGFLQSEDMSAQFERYDILFRKMSYQTGIGSIGNQESQFDRPNARGTHVLRGSYWQKSYREGDFHPS